MTITQHKVVTMQYQVIDVDTGQLIDSSDNVGPMTYLHGAQNIIPGLENALEGRGVGDEIEVTVEPDDAYGDYAEERVQQVPREAFDSMEKVEPGMEINAQTEHGPVELIIVEVNDSTVTVDGNHPLAGRTLTFNVKIESVRDASAEEIEHGHVHGPDGHYH